MNVLVIITHPNIRQSRINRTWMEALQNQTDVTIHQLYAAYPDFRIDVKREQELLSLHDRIILQFPLYWYSTPALLKQWFDVVLEYGWAYGPGGTHLHGKQLGLAISTGGPENSYQPSGYNRYTIKELLKPIQATNHLIGTTFMTPFVLNGISKVDDEKLAKVTADYIQYVSSGA